MRRVPTCGTWEVAKPLAAANGFRNFEVGYYVPVNQLGQSTLNA
jgi:hypothetical protein